ncbi:MAG: roadblock/LC7 domain-containing protein [Meiothermus sp.]|uniref:GTPase-activating protein MglB n=1 Tax=Meiothermus sp. TaxID=1955249 RepID=UPI0025E20500|nr:roadblock/LC7 domain-containing protein [Meiothermus sp.]MCS7059470.1 roadblock/LC7 domain-containing protein [Meiothermus sp.]MCS7193866.1 roadblock/LC7 domain-containing protein [Meiothermus sp.]MCX7740453.1 roadblock/LC7 domain-containing protein [Meiothermus sp.]MDW8090187.1 roadblock/LC7 domain-containing protein [Meiothermus sp.]MDW8481489.1 roadblock/LC7 domain-containing protein [Meiothermus sp.]
MVEPAVALFGEAYEKAARVLEELLRESGARYTLLLDRKGFVLVHKEALWAPKPPALDSLATLIAGNAAATQALARMLGEPRFNELLHQGSTHGLYVEEVGELALLVIVFDSSAPVGRVKLYGKRAAQALEGITQEAVVSPGTLGIDSEYREGASALLDELFGN